jgi:hypothetical protein
MNSHIAGLIPPGTDPATAAALEKLAQAVAQECIVQTLKEAKYYWDQEEWSQADALHHGARRLKQYWGLVG